MLLVLSLLQLVYVLSLSPLLAGLLARFEERLESNSGPPILQPYYDIGKLFRR